MKAEVLIVGDEVMSGSTRDTNSAEIARAFHDAGIDLRRVTQVGDIKDAIQRATLEALSRCEVLVVTGGLGPTADDHTKEDIAELFDDTLKIDETVLQTISRRFAKAGMDMPEINRKQAYIPQSASAVPNPIGSAPGIHWRRPGCEIYLLPGVPGEMRAMLEATVLPQLSTRLPKGESNERFLLRTTGLAESVLAEHLEKITQAQPGLRWAFYPSLRGVDIHVLAAAALRDVSRQTMQQVREMLSEYIYSETPGESIEAVVGELLSSAGRTLVVAESCTGGMLGERLTSCPGSSRYFLGGFITYSNRSKEDWLSVSPLLLQRHGAVSGEVAVAMARGARQRTGADLGVAITGIAGPDGGTPEKPVGLVFVSLADDSSAWVRRLQLSKHRDMNRERSTQVALDMIRRYSVQLNIGEEA